MPKIMAAGDDLDRWEARSADEIKEKLLWDAVEFAIRELTAFGMANIYREGREWTRVWHELGLSKIDDAEGPISIAEPTAAKLVQYALEGDQSRSLLLEFTASNLERGGTLPPSLHKYLISHLRSINPPTRKNTATAGSEIWSRNFMINFVSGKICSIYSVKPKRGKMTEETVAASDIVYHALNEVEKSKISFGTVQNIIFDKDPPNDGKVSERNRRDYLDIYSLIITSMFDDYPD